MTAQFLDMSEVHSSHQWWRHSLFHFHNLSGVFLRWLTVTLSQQLMLHNVRKTCSVCVQRRNREMTQPVLLSVSTLLYFHVSCGTVHEPLIFWHDYSGTCARNKSGRTDSVDSLKSPENIFFFPLSNKPTCFQFNVTNLGRPGK